MARGSDFQAASFRLGADALAHIKPSSLGGKEPARRQPVKGRQPAEPVARSASLDGMTPGRQRSAKRSWLGSIDPALRPDRIRRLALGVLILIASSQTSRRDHLGCRPCAVSQTNVQTNTCDRREPANVSSLYLAIARRRSPVRAPPVLRCPPLNCEQTKTQVKRPSRRFRAESLQSFCPTLWYRAWAHFRQIDRSQDPELGRLCSVFAARSQGGDRLRPSVGRRNVRNSG
jgi:hypothetical protein